MRLNKILYGRLFVHIKGGISSGIVVAIITLIAVHHSIKRNVGHAFKAAAANQYAAHGAQIASDNPKGFALRIQFPGLSFIDFFHFIFLL
jgi:hypothetical protein